jgi:hypothetical protein
MRLLFFLLLISRLSHAAEPPVNGTDRFVTCLKKVTDVMVNDVTSPVAASRYYAYVCLAAYEAASLYDPSALPSFRGVLKGFDGLQINGEQVKETDRELAVLLSILKAGERLLPSGYMLIRDSDSLIHAFSAKDSTVRQKTVILADSVVRQVMRYVARDGFNKLNNYPRYILKSGDGYWKPTPPVFMAPIEPHWNRVRTFVLDSAQQCQIAPPAPYDTSRGSSFFQQLMEVYETGKKADQVQNDIANFWDCNPFAVQQIGHVEFGLKKISPGGHWMGIAGIVCKQKKLSLERTALVHALLSAGLADAFIVCWDEKYRSNRVRPETVIQKLIDPAWRPLLQTPPFPEYVSGHSVASNAAATILTALFGEGISFSDDTEVEFGLPVRTFASFNEAAAEASISRLYGGIHYRDAIEEGVKQGREVGTVVISKASPQIAAVKREIPVSKK